MIEERHALSGFSYLFCSIANRNSIKKDLKLYFEACD